VGLDGGGIAGIGGIGAPVSSAFAIRIKRHVRSNAGEVTFDRPAAPVAVDDDLGHRIYALEKPLQPGDSLQLEFEVRFEDG
jgi:hypothetical protein